jgi:hypothetical protein
MRFSRKKIILRYLQMLVYAYAQNGIINPVLICCFRKIPELMSNF